MDTNPVINLSVLIFAIIPISAKTVSKCAKCPLINYSVALFTVGLCRGGFVGAIIVSVIPYPVCPKQFATCHWYGLTLVSCYVLPCHGVLVAVCLVSLVLADLPGL